MGNFIRLKQLDMAEISGYISQVTATNSFNYLVNNFSYFNTNFNITNTYLNLASYPSGITGTLPEIVNGVRYNIKNLGNGILTITGNSTIDSLGSVSLEKNESIEILGVNNLSYSGWLTILSNPGL